MALTVGFVGQGFIGKSYADDMARRGYKVVRYALEEPYRKNKDKIQECDIVFIAVPTPTTPRGFDISIVRSALKLAGDGATVVVKSTILPGTTRALQKQFPKLYVMHSPEFLVARTAGKDAAKPLRNIVGIPKDTKAYRERAKQVISVLPKAPFELICPVADAEIIKYAGNLHLYLKVLFANIVYDTARATGAEYETIRKAVGADPRIGHSHLQVIHDSGHKGAKPGRGAGGLCFIKDVAAFSKMYEQTTKDPYGAGLLKAAMKMNRNLLLESGKDLDLLEGVHGALKKKSHRR